MASAFVLLVAAIIGFHAWVVVALMVTEDARLRGFDSPFLCGLVVFLFGAFGLMWYFHKIKPDVSGSESGHRTHDSSEVVVPSADSPDS